MTIVRPLVLVVDDDPVLLETVRTASAGAGFDMAACPGLREAIAHMKRRRADLVVVKLGMPDVGGLDVLRAVRDVDPQCQVVLTSESATPDVVMEAVLLGATDYLAQGTEASRIAGILGQVRQDLDRRCEIVAAEAGLADRLTFGGMVGRSPVMRELFGRIRRLAPHVGTALVSGESGTGKELAARACTRPARVAIGGS